MAEAMPSLSRSSARARGGKAQGWVSRTQPEKSEAATLSKNVRWRSEERTRLVRADGLPLAVFAVNAVHAFHGVAPQRCRER